MAYVNPDPESPNSMPKRPRGILKNSGSYQQTSPDPRLSPAAEQQPSLGNGDGSNFVETNGRPSMPGRELSEKEITQMNTEINAGNRHRRNSSNPRNNLSRRQSSQSANGAHSSSNEQDENAMRLKWDEANLYLNEGQMGGRMKITEPKTPFATGYDPAEDEAEISSINAQELAVDELDMSKSKPTGSGSGSGSNSSNKKDVDIPGLDLGEPEVHPHHPLVRRESSDGERRVHVDSDSMDIDGVGGMHHGEEKTQDMSREEIEKHKKFEEARKKHYEMKNIKNLLGSHPEDLDDDEKQ